MLRRALPLALLLAACTRAFPSPPPEAARPECTFTSDCGPLQVCADGRCRSECRADRDCPAGSACRPSSEPGLRVCLAPEAASLCVFQSDCPAAQVCGPDRHCHAECRADRDCPAGDRCDPAAGTCALPVPVGDAGAGCSLCGERCVDLARDPDHCGTCDHACGPGAACEAGECAPVACADAGPCNDACPGAALLELTGAVTSFAVDTTRATTSLHACTGQRDIYFRFHLPQRSFVVAELNLVVGARYVGGVGLLDDCADAAPVHCSVDCGGETAVASAVLPAGDHLLVADYADQPTQGRLRVFPLPDELVVEPLATPASFDLSAAYGRASGPPACGAHPMVHAWWFENQCLSNRVVQVSACGSSPGVAAGYLDGASGAVTACTGGADGGCDLPAGLYYLEPYPLFLFATAGDDPDGGQVHLVGSIGP